MYVELIIGLPLLISHAYLAPSEVKGSKVKGERQLRAAYLSDWLEDAQGGSRALELRFYRELEQPARIFEHTCYTEYV